MRMRTNSSPCFAAQSFPSYSTWGTSWQEIRVFLSILLYCTCYLWHSLKSFQRSTKEEAQKLDPATSWPTCREQQLVRWSGLHQKWSNYSGHGINHLNCDSKSASIPFSICCSDWCSVRHNKWAETCLFRREGLTTTISHRTEHKGRRRILSHK